MPNEHRPDQRREVTAADAADRAAAESIMLRCRWCHNPIEQRPDQGRYENAAGMTDCSYAPLENIERHHQP